MEVRDMRKREEGVKDIIISCRESTLYLGTSSHICRHLAVCLLINQVP